MGTPSSSVAGSPMSAVITDQISSSVGGINGNNSSPTRLSRADHAGEPDTRMRPAETRKRCAPMPERSRTTSAEGPGR